ncbi:MAG: lactonase family protein [Chloroflexi bacterium]|nr:lactonase family protein [Chloroflexota bacterium]
MFLYVGAFTGGFMGGEPAEGVSVFRGDEASGRLELASVAGGLTSPSFLALHPRLPRLYAVERDPTETAPEGSLTTLGIEADGSLRLLGRQPSGGERSNHVSVHPSGRWAFATSPGGSRVTAFALDPEGLAGPHRAVVQLEGRGPEPRRQASAYPHCVLADATGDRVFVCDLGSDRVMAFRFSAETGELWASEQQFAQVSSGAGPRHLAVHPSNRWLYVINELDATCSVFSYEAESGRISILQTISSWPPTSIVDHKSSAEVVIHPNGRLLYTSNRRDSCLAMFRVQEGGCLELLGHVPSQGETPRHFAFSPDGRWCFVANQHSGNIATFAVQSDGRLEFTGESVRTPSPVCVVVH